MSIADLKIEALSVPRASDILAARLRDAIVEGSLVAGAVLPPERTLVVQTGLSRAAVREALRILEAEGLLLIKPGRGGGSFVRQLGHETISRSLGLMIRGQRIRFQDLLAVREGIEPQAAFQAAINATEADLAEIAEETRRCRTQLGDIHAFLLANLDWHMAVVHASHNPLFIAMMESISAALHAATDIENFNSLEIRQVVTRAHERVADAIRERDPAAAKRRMGRHVGAYAEALSSVEPDRLARPEPGGR